VLMQAAGQAEDLLLFYYSGHGLLAQRRGELFLSLRDTRRDRIAFSALPFEAVRDACLESRAASRVVILDSCFSGRAIGDTLADEEDAVVGQLDVSGTYTLASAPANRTALILPGERHTAFTERMLNLLVEGSPEAGQMISLGDIYRHLYRRMTSDGLPTPQQRGTATADLLGLVRNRRFGPEAAPPPALVTPDAAAPSATVFATAPPADVPLFGEDLAEVRADLTAFAKRGAVAQAVTRLTALPPAKAALRLQRLEPDRAVSIIEAMAPGPAAIVLAAAGWDTSLPILSAVARPTGAEIVEHFDPPLAAAMLERLAPERAGTLIAEIDVPLLLGILNIMDGEKAVQMLHHVPPDLVGVAAKNAEPARAARMLDIMPPLAARKILAGWTDDHIVAVAATMEPARYEAVRAAVDPKDPVFDTGRAGQVRPLMIAAEVCIGALIAMSVSLLVGAIAGAVRWEWALLAVPEGLLAAVCFQYARAPMDRIGYPIVGILGFGSSIAAIVLIPEHMSADLTIPLALVGLIVAYFVMGVGYSERSELARKMPRVLPDLRPAPVAESLPSVTRSESVSTLGPTPVVTDRWHHTSDGAKVPSLMRLTHTSMSHPGYGGRQSNEASPSVKIGMLVACQPIGLTSSGSELRTKFLAFLNSTAVRALVGALTDVTPEMSWKSLAGNGVRTLEAALTVSQEPLDGVPAASALLLLPIAGESLYGRDDRSATLILYTEPRTADGQVPPASVLASWSRRFSLALGVPGAFAGFLDRELGLATSNEPPAQLGVWLQSHQPLTSMVDIDGLRMLPGSSPSTQFTGWAFADGEGKPTTETARNLIVQLCEYTLHLDDFESALTANPA